MSQLSSHVLDAAHGRPAEGVRLTLSWQEEEDGEFVAVREGVTDADGRIGGWPILSGLHRLRFDTGTWFAERDVESFYPEVVVAFAVDDEAQNYHVPLLLSPFAYSTYRGS
ncbi:hydroxyisourate hydrolase [Glycomyces buryatensis]|uniref:5-hydroxyisourate hydrolase n=1 Tax=Glycomyces buryatensis TaxID=2570927 RepID=A0A4S8PZU2_9ACTN|nr:hydroxyisourate hydrolase [Glycomyces buryatensis]THV35602.1 hydroxyisourate hydrolase [Glycomyces buryatensis]